jgi:hypothetical protein
LSEHKEVGEIEFHHECKQIQNLIEKIDQIFINSSGAHSYHKEVERVLRLQKSNDVFEEALATLSAIAGALGYLRGHCTLPPNSIRNAQLLNSLQKSKKILELIYSDRKA